MTRMTQRNTLASTRWTGKRRTVIICACILMVMIALVASIISVAHATNKNSRNSAATTEQSASSSSQHTNSQQQNKLAFPSVSLDGTLITEDEYVQTLNTQRNYAAYYFATQHDVDLNADDADWAASYDGDIPNQWITERTISTLRTRHATYRIAMRYGLLSDDSYNSIIQRMNATNQSNAAKQESGEVVYGRSSYDFTSYLDREMTLLKNTIIDNESNSDMAVTDAEVQQYYDSHDFTIDGVDGKAPLSDVRANVKTQIRTERYNNLINAEAESISLANVPWESLIHFTATRTAQ